MSTDYFLCGLFPVLTMASDGLRNEENKADSMQPTLCSVNPYLKSKIPKIVSCAYDLSQVVFPDQCLIEKAS